MPPEAAAQAVDSLLANSAFADLFRPNSTMPIKREVAEAFLLEASYLTRPLSEALAAQAELASPGPTDPAAPLIPAMQKLVGAVEDLSGNVAAGMCTTTTTFTWSEGEEQTSVVTTMAMEADGLRVTAASIAFKPGSQIQDPVSLPSTLFPLARELPICALRAGEDATTNLPSQAIGLSSVRWDSMNPYGPAAVGSGTSQKVAMPVGDVVSLTLRTSQGTPIVVKDLPQPIVLAVPTKGMTQDDVEAFLMNGTFPQCRWLNDTVQKWQGEDCRTLGIQKNGAELVCSCTHLTTFGAFVTPVDVFFAELGDFFEGLVNVLIYCASVQALFSEEGWQEMRTGAWANEAAASLFYILVLLLGGAQIASWLRDIHDHEELKEVWAEMTHVRWFELCRWLEEYWAFLMHPSAWSSHFVRSFINHHVAVHLGISQGSLSIIEEAQQAPEGYNPVLTNVSQRSKWSMTAGVIKAARRIELQRDCVIDDFSLKTLGAASGKRIVTALLILRRLVKLWLRSFVVVHGWTVPVVIDLDSLVSHRTLIVTVQLLGSLWCTALYFHASGTASAPWSPDECVPTEILRKLQVVIPVGFVSTLVSQVPSLVLYNMVGARPCPPDRKSQRVTVAISYVVFYLTGLGLCAFYMIFIASFLANVSAASASYYVLSAMSTMLSSALLMPLVQAAMYSTALVIFLWRDPTLPKQIFGVEPQHEERKENELEEASEGQPNYRTIVVKEAAQPGVALPGQVHEEDNFAGILPDA